MHKKSMYKAIISIAVAMVFIMPVSVVFANDEESIENQEFVGVPIELTPKDAFVSQIGYAESPSGTLVVPNSDNEDAVLSGGGTDILVWTDIWAGEDDCQNAAIVTNGKDNVLVLTEIVKEGGQTALWGRWSIDGGETWSDQIVGWDDVGDYDSVSKPKLDFYEDSWAYGTWTAGGTYDAMTYYLELPDITNPNYDPNGYGWVYYYLDWGELYGFSDFDSADVACYPYDAETSPSPNFWGCIALTGDLPPGEYTEDDAVMFSYFLANGNIRMIGFEDMAEDVDKMTCDIDHSIGQFYMAMEYVNESNPADNGTLFLKAPPLAPNDDWYKGSHSGFSFSGVFNPDVVADSNSVYIIGEIIVDGYTDIVCLYSSNAGASFSSSVVTDTDDDEVFPSITVVGDTVVCTYLRDGDLFVAVSADGGISWDELDDRVNDPEGTVVEQYSSSSIDGICLAWTDSRNGLFEIYFDKADVSVELPVIEIVSISGGLGVCAVIANNGTADATNVSWSITIKGGILGFIDKEVNGTIPILVVGDSVAVKSGLFFGLGKIVVTVTVECDNVSSVEKIVDGKQLIIFTMVFKSNIGGKKI